jgi:antirestriction protein ArdC
MIMFYRQLETEPEDGKDDRPGMRMLARASFVFAAATGAYICPGGERAYYAPHTDHIQMPDEGLFAGTATCTRTEDTIRRCYMSSCTGPAPRGLAAT